MELKQEFVVGSLRDVKQALVPILAAICGMAGPMGHLRNSPVTFVEPNWNGWAVPVATDIGLPRARRCTGIIWQGAANSTAHLPRLWPWWTIFWGSRLSPCSFLADSTLCSSRWFFSGCCGSDFARNAGRSGGIYSGHQAVFLTFMFLSGFTPLSPAYCWA